jgi:hypothetical protein
MLGFVIFSPFVIGNAFPPNLTCQVMNIFYVPLLLYPLNYILEKLSAVTSQLLPAS